MKPCWQAHVKRLASQTKTFLYFFRLFFNMKGVKKFLVILEFDEKEFILEKLTKDYVKSELERAIGCKGLKISVVDFDGFSQWLKSPEGQKEALKILLRC